MFSLKQKTIKNMFPSDNVKKNEKVISKFFLFKEGIHRSEENKDVREADDDVGENVRVLSNSNSDDDKDGDDDGDDDNDNNGGHNDAYGRTYGLDKSQQRW